MILPLSPEVAVVFCNESRCCMSPSPEIMQRGKIPHPDNSLLKDAPHKDVTSIEVEGQKRGRKRWPATTAWRVSIGTLSADHHQAITSYTLSHAQSLLVVRSRAKFERAKRELNRFGQEIAKSWNRGGTEKEIVTVAGTKMTEEERGWAKAQLSALEWLDRVIVPSREPVTRTKENVFKCFQAFIALTTILNPDAEVFQEEGRLMHPALQSAFEAAYPPKHPAHRDLVTIGFDEFFGLGLGEEHFTRLLTLVEEKCRELVASDTTLKQHWAAFGGDAVSAPADPEKRSWQEEK
ncbi:hypothetical protein PG984_011673 [Apiospora sp. TS-2023a]